jgi:hypothetical protein
MHIYCAESIYYDSKKGPRRRGLFIDSALSKGLRLLFPDP